MCEDYKTLTEAFQTPLDFLHFGVMQAHTHQLWYGHGTDNAEDDMVALILGALKLPFDSDTALETPLTENEKTYLVHVLEKRILAHVPVPYLTKEAYFAGLPFYVDERVLIPRSPLAECIQQRFSPWIHPEKIHTILDLCTGSGAIAIACAAAFPNALVDAVDLSAEALAVAKINVERHHRENQVHLIQGDLFENIPPKQYEIIISNPPYVDAVEYNTLPKEYAYEPKIALEAKNNGLAMIEKILFYAKHYLSENGILVVEVGSAEEALIQAYPYLPFVWLEFEHGGEGVFLLMAKDL